MISLILATKGYRGSDVKRFIQSILSTDRNLFELIIVSQDDCGYFEGILTQFAGLPITLIYSEPGLSRARNAGLKISQGDIIAFPDDDCLYPPFLINQVHDFFKSKPAIDILTIDVYDLAGESKLPFVSIKNEGVLKRGDIFKGVSSISIFHRRQDHVSFDECFGLGAVYKSSEEFDYIYRLMKNNGCTLFYSNKMHVRHPSMRELEFTNLKSKVENNAIGHGAFFKKHLDGLLLQALNFLFIRPTGGIIVRLLQGRWKEVSLYSTFLKSRVRGFLWYNRCKGT